MNSLLFLSRCNNCWHALDMCICASLPRLQFRENVNIIVYMDSKEIYNAGDDAKLLLCACPEKTKRFIYGLEDEELVDYLGEFKCNLFDVVILQSPGTLQQRDAVVLFPSDFAISFPEWIDTVASDKAASSIVGSTAQDALYPSVLTVIVVDAVWRHARRMAQRLRDMLPAVRHVQLTPEQMSVYARKQSEPGRICTVEATALFLSLYGEDDVTTEAMVECVRINNAALRPVALKNQDEDAVYLYPSNVAHPAWYFGRSHLEHAVKLKKKMKVRVPHPKGKGRKGP
jgi:DTW domain-containing protein YfiP